MTNLTIEQMRVAAKANKFSDFDLGQKVTIVYQDWASRTNYNVNNTFTVVKISNGKVFTAGNSAGWTYPSSLYIHPIESDQSFSIGDRVEYSTDERNKIGLKCAEYGTVTKIKSKNTTEIKWDFGGDTIEQHNWSITKILGIYNPKGLLILEKKETPAIVKKAKNKSKLIQNKDLDFFKQYSKEKSKMKARFQIGKVYTITNGRLYGQQKVANRVSKCGEYAWFWSMEMGDEIRIHIKHTVLGKYKPVEEVLHHSGTYIAPGEYMTQVASAELEKARLLTSELVSAKDMKRIRSFTNRLRNRTKTVMAEVRALEDVTDEHAPRINKWWQSFGYGVAGIMAFEIALSIALAIY